MKVRIKFTKLGSLRYIGHLDFMRAIQKRPLSQKATARI